MLTFLARQRSEGTAAETTGSTSLITTGAITGVLAGGMLAVSLFQTPHQMLVRFASMDSGGELAIQDLIRRGFRPGLDFGYPYGLLGLFAGRIWYGLAGLAPGSFQGLVLACMVFSAWGLARFAVARGVGLAGLVLIALAIPDLIFVTYLTSVHALEQALLINALAEQARGRRGTALALLTACCFVKPSLAFVQGLAVVIAIVAGRDRSSWTALIRPFVPALVTAGGLALLLGTIFGPGSLARTLSPATGAAIYRANHYGFFGGQGREFWVLPGAGLRDYFRYEVGFWLVGTAVLVWGGIIGVWRLAWGTGADIRVRDDELIVTCAWVHIAFVTLLFGHRVTWVYSLPMLIMGLALLANRGPRHRWIVWAIAVSLLVSDRSKAVATLGRWRTEAASPVTLGLWTTPRERDEWTRALELTREQSPVLFGMCEGGALLFPGFAPPTVGYLVPGNPLPVEVERKARQVAEATWVVSAYPPTWHGFDRFPTLKAAFAGADLIADGQHLWVYRRGPIRRSVPVDSPAPTR